jgi:hypothetical protein
MARRRRLARLTCKHYNYAACGDTESDTTGKGYSESAGEIGQDCPAACFCIEFHLHFLRGKGITCFGSTELNDQFGRKKGKLRIFA